MRLLSPYWLLPYWRESVHVDSWLVPFMVCGGILSLVSELVDSAKLSQNPLVKPAWLLAARTVCDWKAASLITLRRRLVNL